MTSCYRYHLRRILDPDQNRTLLICMLNPSTADDYTDDPTIRRISGLVRREGFGRLHVVNLFAIRATNPREIWDHVDPIGPNNGLAWDHALGQIESVTDCVTVGWGRHPSDKARLAKFCAALSLACTALQRWRGQITAWRLNGDGSPRHPLYLPQDSRAVPFDIEHYQRKLNVILQPNNATSILAPP